MISRSDPGRTDRHAQTPTPTSGTPRAAARPGAHRGTGSLRPAPDRFDGYVSPGRQPNACVAGRRSIAVTDGALQTFLAGRLPADLLAAVLVHELGHHATRAGRCRLGAAWLAAPGRFAFGLIMRLSIGLCGGRRPGPVTALLALVAMGMALPRLVQDQQWLPAAMGIGLAAAFVLTPLLDAAVSRASEHAADRYAHAVGAGPDLSRALTVLDPSSHRPSRWSRPLDQHPPVGRRIDRSGKAAASCRSTTTNTTREAPRQTLEISALVAVDYRRRARWWHHHQHAADAYPSRRAF